MRNLSRTTRTNGENLLFHVINRKKYEKAVNFPSKDMSLRWKKYLKVAFTENFGDILKLLQVVSKLSIKTVFVSVFLFCND